MGKAQKTGSALICEALENLGVRHVFGLPGSQNYLLYESLRHSSIETILPTSELAAAFMANGYYRASGKVGVIITIPGPGFTYAVTGIAEAYLDSAAILCLVGKPAESPGRKFQLQAIEQKAMAKPVVKAYYCIDDGEQLQSTLFEAYESAKSGEPGPVLVEVDNALLSQAFTGVEAVQGQKRPTRGAKNQNAVQQAFDLISQSIRPVLFVGQGASEASDQVLELAELLSAPVLSTTSGRGILSEEHRLSFPFNFVKGGGETMNQLLDASDLVVVLGCKFSHNGSGGFQYRFASEKLIHVDASENVLEANYQAKLAIRSDVGEFLDSLLLYLKNESGKADNRWSKEDLDAWRDSAKSECSEEDIEPRVVGMRPGRAFEFFKTLGEFVPADSHLVTDSGLHQFLVRKYCTVLRSRGLIIPSDFQSMGFGLPAAIGAKLAVPDRTVVAIIGDGSLAMTAMEFATAIREKIPIKVILFSDGHLGLIRFRQMSHFGSTHAVDLHQPDYEKLASGLGSDYFRFEGDIRAVLRDFFKSPCVAMLEVRLKDSQAMKKMRAKSLLREFLGRIGVGSG